MSLIRLFSKPLVVEIPADRRAVISPQDEAAIETLSEHPGFRALMNRLSLQKSLLETELKTKRHAEIRDVDHLQSGIEWISFLERQVNRRVHKRDEMIKRLAPSAGELEEFQNVSALIERVGPQRPK